MIYKILRHKDFKDEWNDLPVAMLSVPLRIGVQSR